MSTCNDSCHYSELYLLTGRTNFTCAQLQSYCNRYQSWTLTEWWIQKVINFSLLTAGFGGLVSYVLMILVFRSSSHFNGPSYVYHKAIAWMELVHMVVMAQSGLERFLPTDKNSYSYVFYIYVINELWIFGDAMKMSTSLLTAFLSVERFVAIWMPNVFAQFNRPKVAWSFVVISFLFSTLSWAPAFTKVMQNTTTVVDNSTIVVWTAVPRNPNQASNVGGDAVITDLIYGAKFVSCAIMAVCCIGVAVGLILKARKVRTMSSTAQANWSENRRLSILQIVIALMQIVDHVTWVVNNMIYDNRPASSTVFGAEAVIGLSYAEAIGVADYKVVWRWTMACQEMTGILDHSTRLPLYLGSMKKFKEAFVSMFTKGKMSKNTVGTFTQEQGVGATSNRV